MNKSNIRPLIASYVICSLHVFGGQPNNALVDEYYGAFNTDDGTAIVNASIQLSTEVPVDDQDELFCEMLERASHNPADSAVIANVIHELYNKGPKFKWSQKLESDLLNMKDNPDFHVRANLVDLLAKSDPVKYRETCLNSLKDSNDNVRKTAILAIGKWQDGAPILNQFITDNGQKKEFTESVKMAHQVMGK